MKNRFKKLILINLFIYFKLIHSANINVGFLIPWTNNWELGRSMGSSLSIAIDEVLSRSYLSGHTINFEFRDSQCDPTVAIQAIVHSKQNFVSSGGLHAIIGAGCSSVCRPVAFLAAAWNVPFVSFGCTSNVLSNHASYPTFSRSVGPWTSLSPMFTQLMAHFNWDRIGIIATTQSIMQLTANAIKNEVVSNGKSAFLYSFDSVYLTANVVDQDRLARQHKVLRNIANQARVIVLLMYDNDLLQLLLSAHSLGMINEEYQYIAFDASPGAPESLQDEALKQIARNSYSGLMSANLRKPYGTSWSTFSSQVISRFNSDPIYSAYTRLPSNASTDEVDVHAGMLHDAVIMWAEGVNKSMTAGYSYSDGRNITNHILSSTYSGITGSVVIDANGDRKPDYSFEVINNQSYHRIFDFYASSQSLVSWNLSNGDWAGDRLVWTDGSRTISTGAPKCGWEMELCPNWINAIVLSVVFGLLILVSSIATMFYFYKKKVQFEEDISNIYRWKIDWSEVQFSTNESNTSLRSSKSIQIADMLRSFYPRYQEKLITYKGFEVHKKIFISSEIDTSNRDFRIEMKHMLDMHHPNVNQFVGICTELPNRCTLFLHAHKGSLQDMMKNDLVHLSWEFKISMALDIAKGMEYLQKSVFISHGSLTSAKCVIDSRWTCKITDYGLEYLRSHYIKPDDTQMKDLLWTAPELLPPAKREIRGTQKGDVYSYGIILQEIILQATPFSIDFEIDDIKQILKRVQTDTDPPFRPDVSLESCTKPWLELMKLCWHHDPKQRPNFTYISRSVRFITGARGLNMVTNMIRMLEKHSENLEHLVVEKSREATQERNKFDDILTELLPRSIATALRNGETVTPDAYTCVTILFSDIQNFSQIVAQSAPIQIIELLNELYFIFERIIDKYDASRVETISDAIMVCSGAPNRNGDRHAPEIATLALNLIASFDNFKIPYWPEKHIQLRLGAHTGPVVAGVVGIKMPKYCIFGESVNTASKLQANSKGGKILLSETTTWMLNQDSEFEVESKGELTIKGKTSLDTFWLLRKKNFRPV